jgi:hypothetical protein
MTIWHDLWMFLCYHVRESERWIDCWRWIWCRIIDSLCEAKVWNFRTWKVDLGVGIVSRLTDEIGKVGAILRCGWEINQEIWQRFGLVEMENKGTENKRLWKLIWLFLECWLKVDLLGWGWLKRRCGEGLELNFKLKHHSLSRFSRWILDGISKNSCF